MSVNGEEAAALADVTNKVNGIQINEEAVKRVRDAHWVEPVKFDYDAYNTAPRDQRSSAPAEGDEVENVPTWAANAIKYEWSDEYGDVGPEHKALEKMLFTNEHRMEKGDEFSK